MYLFHFKSTCLFLHLNCICLYSVCVKNMFMFYFHLKYIVCLFRWLKFAVPFTKALFRILFLFCLPTVKDKGVLLYCKHSQNAVFILFKCLQLNPHDIFPAPFAIKHLYFHIKTFTLKRKIYYINLTYKLFVVLIKLQFVERCIFINHPFKFLYAGFYLHFRCYLTIF